MAKLIHLFWFDIKLLRGLFWIPFLVYIICVILMLTVGVKSSSPFMTYTILQGVAIPISGWHLIFIYAHLYEDGGARELLINYYRKVLIIDKSRYMTIHALFILVLVSITVRINGGDFFNSILTSHLLMLFVFYQIVGIAILSMTKSLEITLGLIATYTFMEVVTQGTFMPWPHLFIFEDPIGGFWVILTYIFLGLGILLSALQLWREFR